MTEAGISLRDVSDGDLQMFFEHQIDPEATRMAAFPARARDAHMRHWRRIMSDETVAKQSILFEGQVAGNIVSWEQDGRREIGYWLGRSFWGRGIATAALSQFLDVVLSRPLYAHVAKHNLGSLRVLEKCGFVITSTGVVNDVAEYVLILRAEAAKSPGNTESRS